MWGVLRWVIFVLGLILSIHAAGWRGLAGVRDGFLALVNHLAMELGAGEEPCLREECWSGGVQEVLASAPLFLACVAMVVVGCFAHRLGWVWRAVIPAVVYLVLRSIQVIIWEPVNQIA